MSRGGVLEEKERDIERERVEKERVEGVRVEKEWE